MNLYIEFKKFEEGMVCFLITEKIKAKIFRNHRKGLFLTSLFLFVIFTLLLKSITFFIFSDALDNLLGWQSVVFTSLIPSYCIILVHKSYSYSIEQLKELENPSILFKTNVLNKWIQFFKSPINQVLFSLLSVILFAITLHWFQQEGLIAFHLKSQNSFLILFTMFWLAQGTYWAVLLPLLTLLFKKIDYVNDVNFKREREYFTENIPMLKALSNVFKYISSVMAFTVILCLVGLLLMPVGYFNTYIVVALVALGYLFTFWTLIFSHINIAKTEKIANEFEINFWGKYITKKNYKLKETNIEDSELIALNSAINIYNFIKENKVKFFNYSLISRSFWSFVIPTVVAILGTLIANSLQ